MTRLESARRTLRILLSLLAAVTALGRAPAAWAAGEEDAVARSAQAFVEAYHRGDASAAAALWTPDGDMVDQTGRVYHGRKAIEGCFRQFFGENKGVRLRIEVASVKFPAPGVAVEDGTTIVIPPDGSVPSRARYTNVLVKRDGRWLVAASRESAYTPPSNYEHLRRLEWTIGEWVDETPAGEVGRLSFRWSPEENFILSNHMSTLKNVPVARGSQRIAWDPATRSIRSWSFEEDGSFGEASWTGEGDRWVIRGTSVLADGTKLTATNIVTRVGPDTLTWQSTDRRINGKPLADISPVRMKRIK